MQESGHIFLDESSTLLRGSQKEINLQLFAILNSIYDGLYITDGDANTSEAKRA